MELRRLRSQRGCGVLAPGRLFKRCSLKIHPQLDLGDFYARPYHKQEGARILGTLEDLIGDSPE